MCCPTMNHGGFVPLLTLLLRGGIRRCRVLRCYLVHTTDRFPLLWPETWQHFLASSSLQSLSHRHFGSFRCVLSWRVLEWWSVCLCSWDRRFELSKASIRRTGQWAGLNYLMDRFLFARFCSTQSHRRYAAFPSQWIHWLASLLHPPSKDVLKLK